MNNMTETTAFGEAFLRDWYRKIRFPSWPD